MKRRLPANDDDNSLPTDVLPSQTRRKRVRCISLEHTLAHMTLGGVAATTSEDVDMWPRTCPPRPCVQEAMSVVFPSSGEEPGTPASEPAEMDVEPTVVSFAGDNQESTRLDIKEVQISRAALECIQRQTKRLPALFLPCQTSQALVLYRAPRPPSPRRLEHTCDERQDKAHEDDVMEVE